MPSSALVDTYSRFGLGKAPIWGWSENAVAYILKNNGGLHREGHLLFRLRANGNTVTVTRVYATIGSYGIYRPLSITKLTPRFPVNVSSRNPLFAPW